MSETNSIWYRMGYALEQARKPKRPRRLKTLADRRASRKAEARDRAGPGRRMAPVQVLDDLGQMVTDRVGPDSLAPDVSAGVVGAVSGLSSELIRAGLLGDAIEAEELREGALRGATIGMIYGRLLHRWLPGPFWSRGVLLGLATHATRSWGGLANLLGPLSPHRRIPVISQVFEVEREEADTLWEHILFGITLAALYRSSRDRSGTSNDV